MCFYILAQRDSEAHYKRENSSANKEAASNQANVSVKSNSFIALLHSNSGNSKNIDHLCSKTCLGIVTQNMIHHFRYYA